MKRATREQYRDARTALDELNAYRPPDGREDDEFRRLNAVAARTQQPLNWWQRCRLYLGYRR